MRKLLYALTLCIILLACSKDNPTPPNPQSCGPDPNLEAIWISDSTRSIETDSNNNVTFDATNHSNYPTDYFKFQFFCLNGIPGFLGEYYHNSMPTTSHDSSQYHLYGNTIYYAPASVTDTALMDRKEIVYFNGKILHLKWSAGSSSMGRHDAFYYLRK